jgi:hypothetical protein
VDADRIYALERAARTRHRRGLSRGDRHRACVLVQGRRWNGVFAVRGDRDLLISLIRSIPGFVERDAPASHQQRNRCSKPSTHMPFWVQWISQQLSAPVS